MSSKLTEEQKTEIRKLLSDGLNSKAIADYMGISARQVAAVAAHVTMGSYQEELNEKELEINIPEIEPQKELTDNKDECIVECKYNKNFKKWEPVKEGTSVDTIIDVKD